MQFRKKPIVIEAMRVPHERNDLSMLAWGQLAGWLGVAGSWEVVDVVPRGHGIDIHTLEGTMRADPGDWIIRGVKGELYPCKPDIFEATYVSRLLSARTEGTIKKEQELFTRGHTMEVSESRELPHRNSGDD